MKKRFYLSVIALLIGAMACNLPGAATPTPDSGPDAAFTFAAQTVEAELTRVALAQPTTPVPAVTETATPQPTATASRTPALSPTPTPIPCNAVSFVQDVTIPDGASIVTGAAFTKTWRLRNTGSCTWNTSYSLVFDRGDKMSGPDAQPLLGSVAPGATADISVSLTAPASAGNYRGYWRLRDGAGVLFGLSTGSFWVDIKAVAPSPTVTSTLPPAIAALALSPATGENGTVYEPAAAQGIPTATILAGDTGSNYLARGYMSFDISTLSGKTIVSATLTLSSCSTVNNPFANLAGIWVAEVQYSLPLSQSAYSLSSSGIQLLNAFPASPIDVTSRVQTRANESQNRFQIRLHPAAGSSNGDGQADYISCGVGNPQLNITYQP
jgi:hypothetical protein